MLKVQVVRLLTYKLVGLCNQDNQWTQFKIIICTSSNNYRAISNSPLHALLNFFFSLSFQSFPPSPSSPMFQIMFLLLWLSFTLTGPLWAISWLYWWPLGLRTLMILSLIKQRSAAPTAPPSVFHKEMRRCLWQADECLEE